MVLPAEEDQREDISIMAAMPATVGRILYFSCHVPTLLANIERTGCQADNTKYPYVIAGNLHILVTSLNGLYIL